MVTLVLLFLLHGDPSHETAKYSFVQVAPSA